MNKLLHTALALLVILGLGACADTMVIGNESGDPRFLDTNYLSIEHPFTDEGAEKARSRADRQCRQQKRTAVQSERACTFEKCVTHFQCVTPKDVKAYGL